VFDLRKAHVFGELSCTVTGNAACLLRSGDHGSTDAMD